MKMLMLFISAVLFFQMGCSASSDSSTPAFPTGESVRLSLDLSSAKNALPLTVGCNYQNEPCVTVKICIPGQTGSTNCRTIPNVLVDTGSNGLRLFKSVVTISLSSVTVSSKTLANKIGRAHV